MHSRQKNILFGQRTFPDEIFHLCDCLMLNLNEKRDEWRKDFFYKFSPFIKNLALKYAAILNNKIFEMVGVQYSTNRPKADQSPYESIEAGLASCTGLKFLLIAALQKRWCARTFCRH